MPTFTNNVTGNTNAIEGVSVDGAGFGVYGESAQLDGVFGLSKANGHSGVAGVNEDGNGNGVYGRSKHAAGVYGESAEGEGVQGISHHNKHSGVVGINDWRPTSFPLGPGGNGGWFESSQGEGVRGIANNPNHGGVVGINTMGGTGVYGTSDNGVGILGTSINYEGIHAETKSTSTAAMAAYQKNPDSDTAALYVKHEGNRTAAIFVGNITVTGEINLANAADCAENFDISAESCAEPGTVMALDEQGTLQESFRPYDKRVAGVISGAGNYKPGLVLDKQQSPCNRKPIALLGKVFCKVDAQFGPIEVGDLLTTSPTQGHAMRVADPLRAFGAVIGKALRPLAGGQGLIPILIALQ